MNRLRTPWVRAVLVAFAVLGTVALIVGILALVVLFLWASGVLNE